MQIFWHLKKFKKKLISSVTEFPSLCFVSRILSDWRVYMKVEQAKTAGVKLLNITQTWYSHASAHVGRFDRCNKAVQ